MPELNRDEKRRLVFVAPWSMFSIILYGYLISTLGTYAALLLVTLLVIVCPYFFPKGGVASLKSYKCIFSSTMVACFLSIAFIPHFLNRDLNGIVWFGSYLSAVAVIELAGWYFDRKTRLGLGE